MKVEHITMMTHNSVIRDTDDITLPTRHHFTGALPSGKAPVLIPGTALSVKVTVEWPVALFTLFKGEIPLLTNVCCFAPEGEETALHFARETARQSLMASALTTLKTPSIPQFIITVPILPMATPADMMLAGEIELYIYNSIYEKYRH